MGASQPEKCSHTLRYFRFVSISLQADGVTGRIYTPHTLLAVGKHDSPLVCKGIPANTIICSNLFLKLDQRHKR